MDTHQLNLFLTLADTLHFSRTGELLHMSPSAVSRAVQRIEDQVGESLFRRDSRRVELTGAGRKFREYARDALQQWDDFNLALREDATRLSGELTVFGSVTAVYSVLADLLGPFRRAYPDIDIILHTGDQADAIDRLVAGTDDIAITARPDHLPRSLQFQTLSHTPLLFLYPVIHCPVGSAVREAVGQGTEPDWSRLPFIISERGQARVQLDRWLAEKKIKARLYAQVSGHEAIVSMVALGFGIGVVPELVLNYSPLRDRVSVLDVQAPLAPFAVGLCARREKLDDPLVRAFWTCKSD
jgi:LysR family positive regulator for ilvC